MRDATARNKLKSEYDAIIIGAGLGGLSCAAHLAKEGLSVAVFEQFYNIGGCCQSFKRKGFLFDASVHAIFGANEMLKIIHELGESVTLKRVEDRVIFPEHTLLVDTIPQMRADLKKLFPHEAQNIDNYYKGLVDTVESLLLRFRSGETYKTDLSIRFGSFYKYFGKTTWQVIDESFNDPKLKAIIYSTQTGFMPERAWMFSAYHIYMERNFYHDTSQVMVSTQEIPNALFRAFRRYNGELYLKTLVKKIRIEDGRAVGVELADGTYVKAKYGVVSNADAKLTFEKMVGLEHVDKDTTAKMSRWLLTPSFIIVNLGLDIDLNKYGIDGANLGYFVNYDVLDMYKALREGILPDDFWMGISFPTIHDPSRAPAGKSIIFLLLPISYGDKNNWQLDASFCFDGFSALGEKGKKYFEFKNNIAEKMIQRLEQVIPDVSSHIIVKDVITPVSFETITLNHKGTGLGWLLQARELKVDQGLGLPIITSIKGLYLSNAWANLSCGCYATITTGKIAAYAMLEKDISQIYSYKWENRYVKGW